MTTETTRAPDATAVQTELMRLEDGAMERWRQGDPMGWTEIVAPEVTYVDPGLTQPIIGHQAYARYMEALVGRISYGASHYTRPAVAVHGEVAVLTFNYQGSTRKADGAVQTFAPWNTTEVYASLSGQWKIVHTHWSFVRHTAPLSVDVPTAASQAPRQYARILGELMALEMMALQGLRDGHALAFCEISAQSVTCFDNRTPQRLDGLAAVRDHMAQVAGEDRIDTFEFIDPRAQVHGETAVLYYRMLASALLPDGAVSRPTAWNCTRVYTRLGGEWRIVHTHQSFIGGQPPAGSVSEAG